MIPGNAARPRGRPRSFDELEALQKATQVFWSKGYDGATIDNLVAGMGVGRPSLYAVFGDKRTLFLRVLRAYAEKKGARAAKALLSPQTLRASLASFLRHTVENADRGRRCPGLSYRVRRAARGRRRGPAVLSLTLRLVARRWWNVVSGTGSAREQSRRTFLSSRGRAKS